MRLWPFSFKVPDGFGATEKQLCKRGLKVHRDEDWSSKHRLKFGEYEILNTVEKKHIFEPTGQAP